MSRKSKNLIFIMTDHQRADSLGMHQAGVEVTPNLNRLASQGTVFERAYDACPLCVPARTALATGKYPTKNGVVINDWGGTTAGDNATIHELLAQHGYDVGHIGVDHIRVAPGLKERVSFAEWLGNSEYWEYLDEVGFKDWPADSGHFKRKIQENRGGTVVECKHSNTETDVWKDDAEHFMEFFWARHAADFVSKKREKPFALFLYLWAPHPPLRVPEPFASMFDPDRLNLPSNVGLISEGEPPAYRKGAPAQLAEGVSMEQWRKVWAAHLGLVNLADAAIGKLLDCVQEQGLGEKTQIVFTSDHGDHLGQHSMYQKMEMYEQAIRVPLIFAGPDIARQTVDTPVSHLDIMPSLLELLGVPIPDDLDGLPLASTLRSGAPPVPRPVFSQYSGNFALGDMRRCVVSGEYKYVWNPSEEVELFDLESDPLEMNNLASVPEHATLLHSLNETLREWGVSHGDFAFSVQDGSEV
jgi:arylsulfatase A-like enzyme